MSYYPVISGGFSFDGVDIAKVGLEYAPDLANTYSYKPTNYNIHEQSVDGHDGGIYYGKTAQPKVFTLRCFFEQKFVDQGTFHKIFNLFKIGKKGKLVFDRRPWLTYDVIITNVTDQMFSYLNGYVIITAKNYSAFGYTDFLYNPYKGVDDFLYNDVRNNSGIPDSDEFVLPPTEITEAITSQSYVMWLYNGGTERADTCIQVAGNAPIGIAVSNNMNNQVCKTTTFTNAQTKLANRHIEINSRTGKTLLVKDDDETNKTLAFQYHYEGFLQLEPNERELREFTYDSGKTITGDFTEADTGKMIYINEWWCEIVASGNGTATFEPRINTGSSSFNITSGTYKCWFCTMNKITITRRGSSMDLSKFKIVYKNTFA